MIRYFDASAWVKRYVAEAHRDVVERLLGDGIVATSRLTEVEVASALARRRREGLVSGADSERALEALRRDLSHVLVVEINRGLAATATELLARRALRAGDAIHLASALTLAGRTGGPVGFVAFDQRLMAAAAAEGLDVVPIEA